MWLLIFRLGPIVKGVAQRQYEVWRGGRVVDGSGLENQHVRKGIVGSNPTPSVFSHIRIFQTLKGISKTMECNWSEVASYWRATKKKYDMPKISSRLFSIITLSQCNCNKLSAKQCKKLSDIWHPRHTIKNYHLSQSIKNNSGLYCNYSSKRLSSANPQRSFT